MQPQESINTNNTTGQPIEKQIAEKVTRERELAQLPPEDSNRAGRELQELIAQIDPVISQELGRSIAGIHTELYGCCPAFMQPRNLRALDRKKHRCEPDQVADHLRKLEAMGHEELVMSIRDRMLARSWRLAMMVY